MSSVNGNARKLRNSYRALQDDLSSVIQDLEAMASSGQDVGLAKAKAQIDSVQQQIGSLLDGAVGKSEDSAAELKRSVVEHPVTALTTAFALGIAAASMLGRRG